MCKKLIWLLIFVFPVFISAQVKYDTIIDNCHFYCASDTLTISYNGEVFYKSTEKVSHWYYSATNEIDFSPKLIDVDCDGLKELVITRYTRGAHCCFGLLIWEFKGGKPNLLFEHEDKDMGGYKLIDIDGDCSLDLLFSDDSWAYWNTDYSRSPSVGVIMKLISGEYNYYDYSTLVPDSILVSSKDYLDSYYNKVNTVRDLQGWANYELANLSQYWTIILQFLEFGYTEKAYCFSLDAWNSSYENYDNFIKDFSSRLYQSDHIDFLKLNNPKLNYFFIL